MSLYGTLWVSIGRLWSLYRLLQDIYGIYVRLYGISMDPYGVYRFLQVSIGSLWVFMDLYGFLWSSMGSL